MVRLASILVSLTSFACIAAAQGTALVDAPPVPSSSEQAQIIQQTRSIAREYSENLPNFICTQTVQRSARAKSGQSWKLDDTLILDVAYSDKGESYRLLSINGKPTKKSYAQIRGAKSDFDFGSILEWIFREKSEALFQWERWTNLRGRPAYVFSYHVDQSHSQFHMRASKFHMIAAFGGLVYVDRETNRVMRITYAPSAIPSDWPITGLSSELDYGLASIGEQQVFLPLHAQLIVTGRIGYQSRNVMDFGNYRKFSAEATLKFEKE